MASSSAAPVRIQVATSAKLDDAFWMLVPASCRQVHDLLAAIQERLKLTPLAGKSASLLLCGAPLPPSESVSIIRDGDKLMFCIGGELKPEPSLTSQPNILFAPLSATRLGFRFTPKRRPQKSTGQAPQQGSVAWAVSSGQLKEKPEGGLTSSPLANSNPEPSALYTRDAVAGSTSPRETSSPRDTKKAAESARSSDKLQAPSKKRPVDQSPVSLAPLSTTPTVPVSAPTQRDGSVPACWRSDAKQTDALKTCDGQEMLSLCAVQPRHQACPSPPREQGKPRSEQEKQSPGGQEPSCRKIGLTDEVSAEPSECDAARIIRSSTPRATLAPELVRTDAKPRKAAVESEKSKKVLLNIEQVNLNTAEVDGEEHLTRRREAPVEPNRGQDLQQRMTGVMRGACEVFKDRSCSPKADFPDGDSKQLESSAKVAVFSKDSDENTRKDKRVLGKIGKRRRNARNRQREKRRKREARARRVEMLATKDAEKSLSAPSKLDSTSPGHGSRIDLAEGRLPSTASVQVLVADQAISECPSERPAITGNSSKDSCGGGGETSNSDVKSRPVAGVTSNLRRNLSGEPNCKHKPKRDRGAEALQSDSTAKVLTPSSTIHPPLDKSNANGISGSVVMNGCAKSGCSQDRESNLIEAKSRAVAELTQYLQNNLTVGRKEEEKEKDGRGASASLNDTTTSIAKPSDSIGQPQCKGSAKGISRKALQGSVAAIVRMARAKGALESNRSQRGADGTKKDASSGVRKETKLADNSQGEKAVDSGAAPAKSFATAGMVVAGGDTEMRRSAPPTAPTSQEPLPGDNQVADIVVDGTKSNSAPVLECIQTDPIASDSGLQTKKRWEKHSKRARTYLHEEQFNESIFIGFGEREEVMLPPLSLLEMFDSPGTVENTVDADNARQQNDGNQLQSKPEGKQTQPASPETVGSKAILSNRSHVSGDLDGHAALSLPPFKSGDNDSQKSAAMRRASNDGIIVKAQKLTAPNVISEVTGTSTLAGAADQQGLGRRQSLLGGVTGSQPPSASQGQSDGATVKAQKLYGSQHVGGHGEDCRAVEDALALRLLDSNPDVSRDLDTAADGMRLKAVAPGKGHLRALGDKTGPRQAALPLVRRPDAGSGPQRPDVADGKARSAQQGEGMIDAEQNRGPCSPASAGSRPKWLVSEAAKKSFRAPAVDSYLHGGPSVEQVTDVNPYRKASPSLPNHRWATGPRWLQGASNRSGLKRPREWTSEAKRPGDEAELQTSPFSDRSEAVRPPFKSARVQEEMLLHSGDKNELHERHVLEPDLTHKQRSRPGLPRPCANQKTQSSVSDVSDEAAECQADVVERCTRVGKGGETGRNGVDTVGMLESKRMGHGKETTTCQVDVTRTSATVPGIGCVPSKKSKSCTEAKAGAEAKRTVEMNSERPCASLTGNERAGDEATATGDPQPDEGPETTPDFRAALRQILLDTAIAARHVYNRLHMSSR